MLSGSRRTSALILTWGAPMFALAMWRISPHYGESLDPPFLLYVFVVPLVPFWILAGALRMRTANGTWRYREMHVRWTGATAAALIAGTNLWWYVEYGADHYDGGGVNFALGCLALLLPVLVACVIAVGLSLAAEPTPQTGS